MPSQVTPRGAAGIPTVGSGKKHVRREQLVKKKSENHYQKNDRQPVGEHLPREPATQAGKPWLRVLFGWQRRVQDQPLVSKDTNPPADNVRRADAAALRSVRAIRPRSGSRSRSPCRNS